MTNKEVRAAWRRPGRNSWGSVCAPVLLLLGWTLPAAAQGGAQASGRDARSPAGPGRQVGGGRPGETASAGRPAGRTPRGSGASQTTASAQAGQPWIVAVLPPNVGGGEYDGPMNSFFATELRGGLTEAGQMVVAEEKVSSFVLRHPLWMQCNDALCFRRFFDELGAELLVRVKVDVVGKNFDFSAEVLQSGGKVRLERRARCDICTLREARATAHKLGLTLGRDLGLKAPPPPKPECSKPADCEPGKICRSGKCVAAPKPKPQCSKVADCGAGKTCRGGKCVTVPKPRPRPRPRPVVRRRPKVPLWDKPHPWGQFALVTGGAALVSLVTGAVLVGIDGRPTCSKPHPTVSCPERYDTMGAGVGLLVFSGLSAAASGLFTYLWWHHRSSKGKHHKVTALVAPIRDSAGGTGMAASIRWEY